MRYVEWIFNAIVFAILVIALAIVLLVAVI